MTGARRAAWVGPAAVAAGTAGVLLFDPFADHGAIGCPLHEMTGLLCPACGTTRAWWLLAHGDLVGVLQHNLLFLPVALWVSASWFATAWPARSGFLPAWVRSPTTLRPRALYALLVLVAAFTVLRNVPAFGWLGPADPT